MLITEIVYYLAYSNIQQCFQMASNYWTCFQSRTIENLDKEKFGIPMNPEFGSPLYIGPFSSIIVNEKFS